MVWHLRLAESGPGNQPECQAVAFRALTERLDRGACDEAEAAGAALRIIRDGEPPNEAVEAAHGPRAQRPVVAAGARAPDDVVAVAPAGDEFADQRRRVLQVGGHDHRRLAVAVIDAGGDGDVAAEIARKPQAEHAR